MEEELWERATDLTNGVVKVDVLTLRSTLAHHGYCPPVLKVSTGNARGVGIVKIEWIALRVSVLMMLN